MMLAIVLAAAVITAQREVVYNASYTDTHAQNVTSFYGNQEASVGDGDHGTVTIDVMEASETSLGLKVTETWTATGRPRVFLGNVDADCVAEFPQDSIQLVTRQILHYFCLGLPTAHDFSVGEQWSIPGPDKSGMVDQFNVSAVNGDQATLQEKRFSTTTTVAVGELTGDGTIVYEPSKVIPISGKYNFKVSAGGYAESDEDTITMHFELASDSMGVSK
jgi:hypothetical protein